jgi:PKD repeat protein
MRSAFTRFLLKCNQQNTAFIKGLLFMLFIVCLALPKTGFAQTEAEPNNNFATSNAFAENVLITGSVCPDGDQDFFTTVLPSDGVVRIYIEATNTGPTNGYFYFEAYDSRMVNGNLFSRTIANYTVAGSTSIDSIDLFCMAATEAVYFKMSQSFSCYTYKLRYKMISAPAAFDLEPNNSFSQAIAFNAGDSVMGHIGYVNAGTASDGYDYYKTVLPYDGKVRIYAEATNTGNSNGYLTLECFDQRKENGNLFNRYVANYSVAGSMTSDSVDLFCRSAGDTFYFRISQSFQCFGYKLTYKMIDPPSDNDIEPNETFNQSISFNISDTVKGHIGYVAGAVTTDGYDYYKTVLPYDGKVRIYAQATNTGNSNGYLTLECFDQRKENGNLFNRYVANYSVAGSVTSDSVDLFCRSAGDTIYFRISQSFQCYGYKLTYKMIDPPSDNDIEPNETFNQAISFNATDTVKGHIGYVAGGVTTDNYDYYKTVLPSDGVVRVYVESNNTGNSNGYLYLEGFDQRKESGNLFNRYAANYSVAGSVYKDSIDVFCRSAGDTFYFRLSQPSQCFGYKLSYKMINTSATDTEDNNSFALAIPVAELQVKKGHIGYQNGGQSDVQDYYKTKLLSTGTLRVYVKSTNTGNTSGYLHVEGYDSRRSGGYVFSQAVANYVAPGTETIDSFNIYCRAVDSFYFNIISSNSCFSYELSYKMINQGTNSNSNDPEPNNSFAEAMLVAEKDTVQANVGYASAGGSDPVDYYKTRLPYKGTLRIYIETKNTAGAGNGYLYLNGYDHNRSEVFNRTVANYVPANTIVYDTLNIFCQAADTFYFKIEQSSTCFSYKIRYEIALGADTAVKVCPGFTTDISALYNLKPFTSFKYENMASPGPAIDPATAGFGTYRLTVFNGVNECSRDTAMITVAHHPKPNLGIDQAVSKCIGFTKDIRNVYSTTGYAIVEFSSPTPEAVEVGAYTLVVTNEFGCKDTAVITVTNYPQPSADFNPNSLTQCLNGNSFVFANSSVISGGTMTYEWNFGDNSTSTQNNPVHTYLSEGTYSIKMIATSNNGCKDSSTKTITVYPKPTPSFTISASSQCINGNSFSFSNASAISSGTMSYDWSFGDNSTSTQANPVHVYATSGNYTVKLVVTSNNGCKDSVSQTINVYANPFLGADKQVTIACYSGTADITTLYNTAGYSSVIYNSPTPSAVTAGIYQLIVTNTNGCKDTANITVVDAPQTVIPSAGAITKQASRECTGPDGWTHYYNDNGTPADVTDDILVLSLKKNGNNIGSVGDGTFQLKASATAGAGSNTAIVITNPLINNPSSYYAMNRYWQVQVTQQPTSNVGVKYYFNSQDVSDINGTYPSGNALAQQLILYKVVGGNPDPTTNLSGAQEILSIMPGSQATTSTWQYTQINANTHVAEFEVTSFSGGGAGITGNGLVLPVKLLSFSAKAEGKMVLTNWSTAQEINSDYFNVERSTDGIHFETVGKVDAAGYSNSTLSYQFSDTRVPWQFGTIYYRLQSVDKDNKTAYSRTIPVKIAAHQMFSITPNPASTYFTIVGEHLKEVMLMDNAGRKVFSKRLVSQTDYRIELSNLAKGMYLVTVVDKNGHMTTEQLIIQ